MSQKKAAQMSSHYLSTAEAAKYLGISINTLRSYITKGYVPAHRVGPRLLKFDPAELDNAIRSIHGGA